MRLGFLRNMRELVSVGLILVTLAQPLGALEELPSAVDKLRFRYEVELENLRAKYAKRLEEIVAEQTKAGELEVAKEAQKELEKIRKQSGATSNGIPTNDAELTQWMTGSKWQAGKSKTEKDGSTTWSHVLTFQADGIVHKSWGRNRPTWKVEGMKLHYEKKVFGFDEGFTQMTFLSGDTKDPKVWKLKK